MCDNRQLRKILLDALRHDPDSLGLSLDSQGTTTLSSVLEGFALYTEYHISEESLLEVIRGTYTIVLDDDKVHATRGHTTDQFEYPQMTPPPTLLYADRSSRIPEILERGLTSNRYKYIEVATSVESAEDSARLRRVKDASLVIIEAEQAWASDTLFHVYDDVWYVQEVAPEFLKDGGRIA